MLKFNFKLYKKVYKPVLVFFFFKAIFLALLTHDEFHTWYNLPR